MGSARRKREKSSRKADGKVKNPTKEDSAQSSGENTQTRNPFIRFGIMVLGAVLASLLQDLYAQLQAPESKGNVASRHPGVVLLAAGRSGSTFLSSWFEGLDEFLLFIEPCASPYTGKPIGTVGSECGKLLDEVMACDFSHVEPNKTHLQNTVVEEFDGWGNRSSVERCHEQITVVKEIRLGAWAFNRFGRSFSDDAKVVLLFRDPRATFASRLKNWMIIGDDEPKELLDVNVDPKGFDPRFRTGHPYRQSIRSYCFEQTELLKTALALDDGVVEVVEYKDILQHPLETADRVFRYIGVPTPEKTREHIMASTSGDCKFKDKAFSVCRNTKPEDTDTKWLQSLPLEHIRHIEEECSELLGLLNYPSYDDYRNMQSTDAE